MTELEHSFTRQILAKFGEIGAPGPTYFVRDDFFQILLRSKYYDQNNQLLNFLWYLKNILLSQDVGNLGASLNDLSCHEKPSHEVMIEKYWVLSWLRPWIEALFSKK